MWPSPRVMLLAAGLVWWLVCPPGAVGDSPSDGTGRSINFENEIIPILDRYGCNASGCHGKAEGQNGFKLSVFGFDPEADYRALVMEGRGRRVFPAAPARSLLLRKIDGGLPHGGGIRIPAARPEHRTLHDWIASGAPFGSPDDPRVVAIDLRPNQVQMKMGAQQRLTVTATWSDGRQEDVTPLAGFQTNNEGLATVSEDGVVTSGEMPGSVAVMATYLGHVDVLTAIVPRLSSLASPSETRPVPSDPAASSTNVIDALVDERLRLLNIPPSPPADDATFLRRIYLDLIGTLPTADECRSFFADSGEDRRARLVARLLRRPEYADYWALKWADLLRVNRRELGRKKAFQYYQWIRASFARNQPLDQFAQQLIAADGPLDENPSTHFFQVVKQPHAMASTLSQVFLGVRIECAQCHHHPFDRWSQTDFYGMQAYFTEVAFKTSSHGETLVNSGRAKTKHPRTGELIAAHPLGEADGLGDGADGRRRQLAAWMTSGDNAWFARNLANRIWAHLMGRGLVEPVDDFRLTNPPTNGPLLDALAAHLVANRFDQHELIRLITSSAAYQRSSHPSEENRNDEQAYSRFLFKRLDAEVLLDAVCQVTGSREKFHGVPAGRRAIQLWDSEVPHDFLRMFGRPVRATACECERVAEPTVGQVLHVLNSPEIQVKLADAGGRIATLEQEMKQDDRLVEELYLAFFSRPPLASERAVAVDHLQRSADRRQATEDLAWSMLNSLEFLYNH